MIWESAVRLREDRVDLASDRAEKLRPQDARGADSRIHDDPERPLKRNAGRETARVFLIHGDLFDRYALVKHAGGMGSLRLVRTSKAFRGEMTNDRFGPLQSERVVTPVAYLA